MMAMTSTKRSVVGFSQHQRKKKPNKQGHVLILKETCVFLFFLSEAEKNALWGIEFERMALDFAPCTQRIAIGDWYTVADHHVVR